MTWISLAETIKPSFAPRGDSWVGSRNAWIRGLSNCQKGKIGQTLMSRYFVGCHVADSGSPEYDLVVGEDRVEVKLSCLNETGLFKWLQIRPDDDFTYLALLAVYPDDIRAYLIPKPDIQGLKPQHRGSRGDGSLMYLSARPGEPWLRPYEVVRAD